MKHIALKTARLRAELTQKQLGDLSGVDRSRIARLEFEATANPTLDTFNKLTDALRKVPKGLRRNEKLTFGPADREAMSA